jgi:hypothetical protein
MIERMSEVLLFLAQFTAILWPLFILAALIYSLQLPAPRSKSWRGFKRGLRNLGQRLRRNLLATWLVLLPFWGAAQILPGKIPGLLPEPWHTGLFLGGLAALLLAEAGELGLFRSRLRAHVALAHAQGLRDLKVMDPYAFEMLVAETYRMLGYAAQHVGRSGDHGVDVELRARNGDFWVVQCKRYRDTVGESKVRELYGVMVSEKADRAVLVTTADITPPARAWARGKPIDLVDGAALMVLIDQAKQRGQGSLIDRLALWMEDLLAPPRPRGLRGARLAAGAVNGAPTNGADGGGYLDAKPDERQVIQYVRGTPVCPNCRMPMLAIPSRPTDRSGRAIYRCRNYPRCRVTLAGEKRLSPAVLSRREG